MLIFVFIYTQHRKSNVLNEKHNFLLKKKHSIEWEVSEIVIYFIIGKLKSSERKTTYYAQCFLQDNKIPKLLSTCSVWSHDF